MDNNKNIWIITIIIVFMNNNHQHIDDGIHDEIDYGIHGTSWYHDFEKKSWITHNSMVSIC